MRLQKVLIANRGEIACRIIRSCHSIGLKTVAVYSDADRDSAHVHAADESCHIGESSPRKSYLLPEKILAATREVGADSIHPGYGFLAENADFAESVIAAGLTWIGPAPDSIREMGDKERAREIARAASVPILPGSPRLTVVDDDVLATGANKTGFPVLVKAVAGGGGIGMRQASNMEQLLKVAVATNQLAERAFGNGDIYLERYVARARHIEVQVFGFGDGRAVHLFERECSIQRRFQKVIEESPSPRISAETRKEICDVAVTLAAICRYAGAGTVEFVFDDDSGKFFFLEMNTRIQVEHPVTEMITGVDIVGLQLRLAGGDDVADVLDGVVANGHAIECRLYAENPAKMFLPSPGVLKTLRFPEPDPNIRVDSGVREGDAVTPYYDPMIAKIICHGACRDSAIRRMAETLAQVRVEGPETNLPFLVNCIRHPDFIAGRTTTGFIDEHRADLI